MLRRLPWFRLAAAVLAGALLLPLAGGCGPVTPTTGKGPGPSPSPSPAPPTGKGDTGPGSKGNSPFYPG